MSRAWSYGIVVLLIAGVIAASAYQEQIHAFFALRMWDRQAPARTVQEFLTAGFKGDQQGADAHLDAKELRPLTKDGQWVGYTTTNQAGTLDFDFKELTDGQNFTPAATEFISIGRPAAIVTMPDAAGKDLAYRLEPRGGSWKITEIRGGHPRN